MSILADVAMGLLALGMLMLLGRGVASSARLGGRDAAAAQRLGRAPAVHEQKWIADEIAPGQARLDENTRRRRIAQRIATYG